MSKFQYYAAMFILLLSAFFLRTWQLSTIPAILNPDEASIAYNAYLLLNTGADEVGKPWPLVLEAFGDQKIIGYTAATVVSFMVFGVSDAAVRIPAVLAGMGIVLLSIFFMRRWGWSREVVLATVAIISMQPVFIWYSRVAFEATVSLLCMLFVFYLALAKTIEVESNKQFMLRLVAMMAAAVLSVLFYNAPLVLLPVIAALIPLWHGLRVRRAWVLAAALGATWLVVFVALTGLTQQKSQITLFADPTTAHEYALYREGFAGIWQKLLGNKAVFYTRAIAQNYWQSIQPSFHLYNNPGHPWHTIPGFGYLTIMPYLFGWVGVFAALKQYFAKPSVQLRKHPAVFLVLLSVAALLPAAISVNAPHATRSLLFFWSWSLLAAYGIFQVLPAIKVLQKLPQALLLTGVLGAVLLSSAGYVHALFVRYPQDLAAQSTMQVGFEQAIQTLDSDPNIKQVVVVDTRGFHYILTAWYTRMQPEIFRETLVKQLPDVINFRYGERVGKYHFVKQAQDDTQRDALLFWEESEQRWVIE